MQSSGAISLSHVQGQFGSSFKSLSNCYGIAAGVPTSGVIALTNMYGKAASIPSVGSISTSNVSTHVSSQNGAISLSSLFTDVYGAPFTYSAPTFNASIFNSASVSSGVLSFAVPGNRFASSAPISVTVTNRFGRTATISYPFRITGSNIVFSNIGSTSLTNNTTSYNMASYFTDFSGTGLSYTITNNPYSNAYLSGSTLFVPANYRNATYNVTVQASNSFGQTASTTITVTEGLAPPSASSMGSTSTLNTTQVNYYLYSYFSGTITSFSITSSPYSNASISGGYLYINPNNRNTSYYITVTAYNSGGSASSSVLVTEGAAPVSLTGTPTSYSSSSSPGSSYITDFNLLTFTPTTTSVTGIAYNISYSKPNTGFGLDAISAFLYDTVSGTTVSGSSVNGSTIGAGAGSGSIVQNIAFNATLVAGRTYAIRISWWSPGAQFTSISTSVSVYYQSSYSITRVVSNNLHSTSGATLVMETSVDDSSYQITIPFTWTWLGTNYGNNNNGGVYIGTNSYITFGGGSSAYSGLSASNPALRTIHLGSADNSMQRLYVRNDTGNGWYYVRFEGTVGVSGTVGAPNIVWQALFLNPNIYGSSYPLHISVGQAANTSGLGGMVTNGSSSIATFTYSADTYYEFRNF